MLIESSIEQATLDVILDSITSYDDFEISILDHIANEIELKDKELIIQKDSYNIE